MPENVAYPLTALVGQDEVKDALLLAAVNPRVQGVLLIGAKGTGKTTALVDNRHQKLRMIVSPKRGGYRTAVWPLVRVAYPSR